MFQVGSSSKADTASTPTKPRDSKQATPNATTNPAGILSTEQMVRSQSIELDSASVTIEAMQLLSQNGNTKSAEVLFQRALAINETTYGIGHPLTIASVVDCSKVLQHQKKYEEAAVLCRMELRRAEKVLKSEQKNIAPLLADFAYVTQKAGRCKESIMILWRELELREDAGDVCSIVRCLIRLCKALRRGLDLGKSISVARRAVELATSSSALGKGHVETISASSVLAETLHRTKAKDSKDTPEKLVRHSPCEEALSIYRETYLILQRQGGNRSLMERISKGLQRESDCCQSRSASDVGGSKQQSHGGVRGSAAEIVPEKDTCKSRQESASSKLFSRSGPGESIDSEPVQEVPLPIGWKIEWTPSGRRFFVNRRLRKTTWVDPRLISGADNSEHLPPGWEKGVDADGEGYYIDHNTRATQRDPPTLQHAVIEMDDAELEFLRGRDSRGSWGSISSIFSSVSSLTRSVSSASLSSISSSFTTAKSMWGSRADLDSLEPGQLTAGFWNSLGFKKSEEGGGMLPQYVGDNGGGENVFSGGDTV
jgi:tetratricopeptide (TPR) repeat protein